MIAYIQCACRSKDRLLVDRLRKEGFEVRIVKGNPEWRNASARYRAKLPFSVKDGIVTEL